MIVCAEKLKEEKEEAETKFQEFMAANEDEAIRENATKKFNAANERREKEFEKINELDAEYTMVVENMVNVDMTKLDAKDQSMAQENEEYKQFLKAESYMKKEGIEALKEAQKRRMTPTAVSPFLRDTMLPADRDGNRIYHTVVHKP